MEGVLSRAPHSVARFGRIRPEIDEGANDLAHSTEFEWNITRIEPDKSVNYTSKQEFRLREITNVST